MNESVRVPTVLLVNPDPIERDQMVGLLRGHLGASCRVLGAGGLRESSDVLTVLTVEGSAIALAVSSHRLPDGTGIELFGHLRAASPATRRVLMTSMDQADAALQAINQSHVDRYLVLPADPLPDRLFPIVDDLLADWFGQHSLSHVGVTVLGHRFAANAYLVRDYLTRSLVPFTWLDLSDDPEAEAMALDLNLPHPAPTTVLLDDGRALYDPTIAELAVALGLTQNATLDRYDLVVVGGGPAGLSAAVYAAAEGLTAVVIEDDCPGGQAATTATVENHLGFPAGLTGADFAHRALAQAKRLGVEWCAAKVATALVSGTDGGDGDGNGNGNGRGAGDGSASGHRVLLGDGSEIVGRCVLIATGMDWRRLDAPGAEALVNAGVYYGYSPAEALRTEGEQIVVVGSGNPAARAALDFARHARSVALVVREPSLREAAFSEDLARAVAGHEGVTVYCGTEVGEVRGYGRLEKVVLLDRATGEVTESIAASSLYALLGTAPSTEWLRDTVGLDEFGFVLTGAEVSRRPELLPRSWPLNRPPLLAETSVPGVFAAGDVRAGSVKRIGSAVGQGAVAVAAVTQYFASLGEGGRNGAPGEAGRLGEKNRTSEAGERGGRNESSENDWAGLDADDGD